MEEIRKILVVDDEPDLQHLMRQKFRRKVRNKEWELTFAHNGMEALEALQRDSSIEMVLSDINMPRMDGLALLDQLAKLTPDIRAVIVSAYGDMDNIRVAMNRGAFDFLTKPINFSDLEITIEKTLRHVGLLRKALQSRDQLVALRQELEVARAMQKSILPTRFPETDAYQIWAQMTPARGVAGDFFDIIPLEDGKVGLAMADVSGKGVPAALFMMVCRTMIKGSAVGLGNSAKILMEVNDLLYKDNDANMFVTAFFHVLDPNSGAVAYANAGHDRPLVVRANGEIESLDKVPGIALGIIEGSKYKESSTKLADGDLLFTYTDGVTEAENPDGEQLGLGRLRETLSGLAGASARETTEGVVRVVSDFMQDADQLDDITCMAIRYGAKP